eukprot:COSAG02_NODE_410_length_22875_cov_43.282755_19_plen_146_part_00
MTTGQADQQADQRRHTGLNYSQTVRRVHTCACVNSWIFPDPPASHNSPPSESDAHPCGACHAGGHSGDKAVVFCVHAGLSRSPFQCHRSFSAATTTCSVLMSCKSSGCVTPPNTHPPAATLESDSGNSVSQESGVARTDRHHRLN